MSAMRALELPEAGAESRAAVTLAVLAPAARPESAPRGVGRAQGTSARGARPPAGHGPAGRRPATRATAVRGPAERQAASVPLRLTRRGRIVVAVAATLLVSLLSLLGAQAAQATGHSGSSRGADRNLTQVVVRPGQSLWSLAEAADPNADPRQVMQQIIQLNGLTSDAIMAGQQLWVPRD
jgi:hypothetical protein